MDDEMDNKGHLVVNVAIYIPVSCSLFTLGMLQEPFRAANSLLGVDKYRLSYVAHYQHELQFTSHYRLTADNLITDDFNCDLLIIASDCESQEGITHQEKKRIQQLYLHKKVAIIGCFYGVFWLAEAGLLENVTSTVHWSIFDTFADRYEQLSLTTQLYEQHKGITTCAGGGAIFDCLLTLIEEREGHELASSISELLCIDRIRPAEEKQRFPINSMGGDIQPRLTLAIELMESNLEEPLSTDDIAEYVNISRRQLERLFKRYLDSMPAKYYLQLRLKKAKQLLLTTNKSIVQIGLSCGFSSGPPFSSAYKSYYLITPRDERSHRFHR
jgi:transcriptional regulator GlxA family with amidase domain